MKTESPEVQRILDGLESTDASKRLAAVEKIERITELLSIPLADGSTLKIGDCFTVTDCYPFFSDGNENYNAEVCWCSESYRLFYDVYPVSDRVRGAACGGSFDEDLPISQIVRRSKRP